MPVIAIRLPAIAVNDDRRPPTPAVSVQIHPTAIRRESVIKIIHRRLGRRSRRHFRGLGWRRGGRVHHRAHLLQLLITLQHRIGDGRRRSQVVEVNDFIRIEVKGAGGVADVSQNDALLDAGLHQTDDLGERAVGIHLRWQCAGNRSIVRIVG